MNEIIGGDAATLERVAEAFVARQAERGVAYTEVRYDPIRAATSALAGRTIAKGAVVQAVERGLAAGAALYGGEAHQLLCAMRGSPASACFELVALGAAARSGKMGGVVGVCAVTNHSVRPASNSPKFRQDAQTRARFTPRTKERHREGTVKIWLPPRLASTWPETSSTTTIRSATWSSVFIPPNAIWTSTSRSTRARWRRSSIRKASKSPRLSARDEARAGVALLSTS